MPDKPRCVCAETELQGKHSGRLVTFITRTPDKPRKKWQVTVCWNHRKWYSGWKSAEEVGDAKP